MGRVAGGSGIVAGTVVVMAVVGAVIVPIVDSGA